MCWLVPLIGYLPVTLVFAAAADLADGLSQPQDAVDLRWCFGLVVVVLFKASCRSRSPGRRSTNTCPARLRSFFILYF